MQPSRRRSFPDQAVDGAAMGADRLPMATSRAGFARRTTIATDPERVDRQDGGAFQPVPRGRHIGPLTLFQARPESRRTLVDLTAIRPFQVAEAIQMAPRLAPELGGKIGLGASAVAVRVIRILSRQAFDPAGPLQGPFIAFPPGGNPRQPGMGTTVPDLFDQPRGFPPLALTNEQL